MSAMSIMNRVTLQSMRKNRTRTIVTIIGIILSAAMFSAVLTLCTTVYKHLYDEKVYDSGSWHIYAKHANGSAVIGAEADERLEYAALAEELGCAKIDSVNGDRPYITLVAADAGFFKTMPVHLTGGRLPENGNEIILPEHLMLSDGSSYRIGDTLTLDLGPRILQGGMPENYVLNGKLYQDTPYVGDDETLDITQTVTLTVVGICTRPSFEPYAAPGCTALTLMTGETDAGGVYECYLRLKDPRRDMDDFTHDHADLIENGAEHNSSLLAMEGASDYDNINEVLLGMALILFGLIFVGSVSLIYNAFSISVSERTKQFGLLASIGATRKQIRRSVIFEALAVSGIGIPIGVLAGAGGIAAVTYLLRDVLESALNSPIPFRVHFTWAGLLGGALAALVTVLVSAWIPSIRAMRVSPMEAIRQSRDVRVRAGSLKTSKLTLKLFGTEGMLARKYFKRSRGKYRATIISLAMSVILFVSASAFILYASRSADSVGGAGLNFDCSYAPIELESLTGLRGALAAHSTGFAGYVYSMDGEDQRYVLLSEDDKTGEFTNAYSAYSEYCGKGECYLTAIVQYMDDVSFREMLRSNGISEEGFFDPEAPLAVVLNRGQYNIYPDGKRVTYAFNYMKPGTETLLLSRKLDIPAGHIAWPASWTGGKDGEGELTVKIEPAEEYLGPYDENGMPLDPDWFKEVALEFDEIKIGALIEEHPLGSGSMNRMQIYYPLSLYKGDITTAAFYFTSGDVPESISEMTKIMEGSGISVSASSFFDAGEYRRSGDNAVLIVKVFSYGFIVLISLICVANVFNTISTNVALRRRDYAMLRSMGMTDRGVRRMSNYECVIYGLRALIIGLPIAFALSFLIYRVVSEAVVSDFTLPWGAIAIAFFSVFLVVFASMLYSTNKLKKETPIDALKDDNA